MTNFTIEDDIALLALDDGKANAVNLDFIATVNDSLDRAAAGAKAIVIAGRPGRFCGGFDLSVVGSGGEAARELVGGGASMLRRLYMHPQPVVIACTGHAVAAGAFILLAADTRVGAEGDFKIGLNETAIGMGLPPFGVVLAEDRLAPTYLTRAAIQSVLFDPAGAVAAGFLDTVAPAEQVIDAARQAAVDLLALPGIAYGNMKATFRAKRAELMTA